MNSTKQTTNGHTSTPPGADLLDAVAAYIRQHLICDDHQLTLLTLWTACTRFEHVFTTAPYLDIRSVEPCSGKTTCLNVLDVLCYNKGFLTGVPAATLIERCLRGRCFEDPGMSENQPFFTLLLDDCHHTLNRSELQSALALLNSGSEVRSFFPLGEEDYYFFGPKAFASSAPLPRSLAARCIPIVLRRPRPSEKFNHQLPYHDDGDVFSRPLEEWAKNISRALAKAAQNEPAQLPPTLLPGQQRCVEPLIHIADFAGGSWPQKARAAAVAVFDLADASPHLQMLWDVRSVFREKNKPEYLPTSDLLSELRKMESRPWSAWGPKSGRRIATLLHPFGIFPRRLQ
ncbi:MAG TPA: DUF3631 domain-containing protein, partial [Candidatus Angelobacter sp.]|nr:DUF3631 domain-containing protein [Candidatus Angelobacter sp.]